MSDCLDAALGGLSTTKNCSACAASEGSCEDARQGLRIVTIDGPAGVGKSTLSRYLAAQLRFTYMDTGAMYRSVAWAGVDQGLALDDEQAIATMLEDFSLELLPAPSVQDDVGVVVNGREIGSLIRTPEMGGHASKVSSLPVVRKKMTELQQKLGQQGGIVVEGRDTGSVVFPRAIWKFYLDAAVEIRAERRYRQLQSKGEACDLQHLIVDMAARDEADSQRTVAPLIVPQGAVVIDTGDLDQNGVLTRMLGHILLSDA